MTPLVSIVIPTFNRAHLISETLDSVIQQTYQNWECIIVDDGSTDNTLKVLKKYCGKDERIRFYKRPGNWKKGANPCRNYGFDRSKGQFINWFDSDDLMLKDNIQLKIMAFKEEIDLDFVVGNSINFDLNGNISRPYTLNYDLEVTPENFIKQKIGWITNDVMIRKSVINIRFNENLESGQEFNFFLRLLHFTNKGIYLKKDIAKRRIHNESIQGKNDLAEKLTKQKQMFINEIFLWEDLKHLASEEIKGKIVKKMLHLSYVITPRYRVSREQGQVVSILKKEKKIQMLLLYSIWITTNLVLGRGYYFLRRTRRLTN